MAYPCIVHGNEIGKNDCGVCPTCESEVHNGKWCKIHQIFHWRGTECPICRMAAENISVEEIVKILEGEEV